MVWGGEKKERKKGATCILDEGHTYVHNLSSYPPIGARVICAEMPGSLANLNWLQLSALCNVIWTASAFSFWSSPSGIRSDSVHVAAHRGTLPSCRARPTRGGRQRTGLHMEQPYINESDVRENSSMAQWVSVCVKFGSMRFSKTSRSMSWCMVEEIVKSRYKSTPLVHPLFVASRGRTGVMVSASLDQCHEGKICHAMPSSFSFLGQAPLPASFLLICLRPLPRS